MVVRIVPVLCLGWLLGIGLGSIFSPVNFYILIFLSIAAVFLTATNNLTIGFLVLALVLGLIRADLIQRKDIKIYNEYGTYSNVINYFEGEIDGLEDRELYSYVWIKNISLYKTGKKLPGRIQVKMPLTDELKIGDKISLLGKAQLPEKNKKIKGNFNPEKYYARLGIYSLIVNPRIINIEKGREPLISSLRNMLRTRIQHLLPEPAAGLTAATLLGFMHDLPYEIRESFSNSGLAHLVAISGQHIAMLSVMIFLLSTALGLNRNFAVLVTTILSVVFILLVDFPPSGIRSVIMAAIVFWAYFSGRRTQGVRALLISCFLMTLINPRILLTDVGFQLSALAMWGMIVIYPIVYKFVGTRDFLKLKATFVMTFSVMLITSPIIIYSFERLSLVGLISNIIAAPIYPFVMVFGFLAILLGSIFFIGPLMILIANYIANFFLAIVNVSSTLPGANISMSMNSKVLVFVYFLMFFFSLIFSKETRSIFLQKKT